MGLAGALGARLFEVLAGEPPPFLGRVLLGDDFLLRFFAGFMIEDLVGCLARSDSLTQHSALLTITPRFITESKRERTYHQLTQLLKTAMKKLATALTVLTLSLGLLPISAAAKDMKNVSFETVATLGSQFPPGNIAIVPSGRTFLSIHGFYGKPTKVVELLKSGSVRPYPNQAWQSGSPSSIHSVLGVRGDQNGILWMLDTASDTQSARLIGWDTKAEKLHQVVYLSAPISTEDSFFNDIAIDTKHNFAYLADTTKEGALVSVNLSTGEAKRQIAGSRFTQAEDIDLVIDGEALTMGGAPVRLGADPITISTDFDTLYFGALSGTKFYAVPTQALRDFSLSDEEIEVQVSVYGNKPISDGTTIDTEGNLYLGEMGKNAIGVTRPDGTYSRIIQDPQIQWADGFAVGADGYMYATLNQLQDSPPLNDGVDKSTGEYHIIRFKPLAEAVVGR